MFKKVFSKQSDNSSGNFDDKDYSKMLEDKISSIQVKKNNNKKGLKDLNKNSQYFVIDTETTGLSGSDHAIEFGVVEVLNGKLTGNQFHCYFRPRKIMSREVISVHGMDNTFYEENIIGVYNEEKNILLNFLNFIGPTAKLVAHNALFDMRMVNRELERHSLKKISKNRWICTVNLFKTAFAQSKASLSFCCKYLGINTKKELLHSAVYDAFICAKVFCLILKGKENPKGLDNFLKLDEKNKNEIKQSNEIDDDLLNDLSSDEKEALEIENSLRNEQISKSTEFISKRRDKGKNSSKLNCANSNLIISQDISFSLLKYNIQLLENNPFSNVNTKKFKSNIKSLSNKRSQDSFLFHLFSTNKKENDTLDFNNLSKSIKGNSISDSILSNAFKLKLFQNNNN